MNKASPTSSRSLQGSPSVEIMGPWLQNNGDGLNLWSVVDRLSDSASLAVSTPLGLDRLPDEPLLSWVKWTPDWNSLGEAIRAGSPSGIFRLVRDGAVLALAPRAVLEARGLVPGRQLTALLDCSGYAYGDVWGTHRVRQRTAYYRRLKNNGSLLVMLPQAFGPFEKPEMRRCASELLGLCDLIWARDRVSLEHLETLSLGDALAGIAPDITHLLQGTPPQDPDAWRRRVCIVPNARMLDRTAADVSRRYTRFLLDAIGLIRGRGLEPWLVVHEKNDLSLAAEVRDADAGQLPILNEDALVSKGVLGASFAVIGSRYHALVSALSQGVPTIGTSWSHKYSELFDDYGAGRFLLSPAEDEVQIHVRIRELLDAGNRDRIAAGLTERAAAQKAKVEAMWQTIESRMARHRQPHSVVS